MRIGQKARIHEWDKLRYYNPTDILRRLRKLEWEVAHAQMDEHVRRMRTNKLKKHREARDAALFCHGMGSAVLETTLFYARHEAQDYDFVTRHAIDDELIYTPVQMKELVPQDLNPRASIEATLAKLGQYPDSKDVVAAIYINRRLHLELSTLSTPSINMAQIWLFGCSSIDQTKWFLYGDLLNNPQPFEYGYPT